MGTFIAFCLPEEAANISPLMEVMAARYPTTSSFFALMPEWFNRLPLPLIWAANRLALARSFPVNALLPPAMLALAELPPLLPLNA